MAQNFRYASIYGSDNTFAVTRRQNIDAGTADGIDLLSVTDHSELTTVVFTASNSGTITVSCTDNSGFFVGDRLTVLVLDDSAADFGLGFRHSGSSPEIPSGSPTQESVFEFMFDGTLWMLTNYQIF